MIISSSFLVWQQAFYIFYTNQKISSSNNTSFKPEIHTIFLQVPYQNSKKKKKKKERHSTTPSPTSLSLGFPFTLKFHQLSIQLNLSLLNSHSSIEQYQSPYPFCQLPYSMPQYQWQQFVGSLVFYNLKSNPIHLENLRSAKRKPWFPAAASQNPIQSIQRTLAD